MNSRGSAHYTPTLPHGGRRQGAGRPKSEDAKVSQSITVLSSTKKILDTLAFSKNKTVGEVIDEKFNSAGVS